MLTGKFLDRMLRTELGPSRVLSSFLGFLTVEACGHALSLPRLKVCSVHPFPSFPHLAEYIARASPGISKCVWMALGSSKPLREVRSLWNRRKVPGSHWRYGDMKWWGGHFSWLVNWKRLANSKVETRID